jgi:flagellar biogenesis protein FliO
MMMLVQSVTVILIVAMVTFQSWILMRVVNRLTRLESALRRAVDRNPGLS